MSDRADRTAARGLRYYLGLGVSAGILAFVVLVGALVIVIPAISGSTPMTVLTSSMEPTYPPGTLIIVKPIAPEAVRMGDALTYQIESGKPAVVTHRVTAIQYSDSGELTFITKGDNNGLADKLPVMPVQIKGTVWYSVPWIGYVNNIINGDARSWIVPLIATGLLLYGGYAFASGIVTTARKRRQTREGSPLTN
jgi:signal peptidase I